MYFREYDNISVLTWHILILPFSILVTVKQHITQTKQQLAATNRGVTPLCIAKYLFYMSTQIYSDWVCFVIFLF